MPLIQFIFTLDSNNYHFLQLGISVVAGIRIQQQGTVQHELLETITSLRCSWTSSIEPGA